jgi:hypothetical protein
MTTATESPKRDWARIGLWLVGATMAYNVIEAGVALWFGASAESIALLGFGLDSVIECAAAGVLLWRLALEARGADPERLERAERRVHRFVGATFLALAAYVMAQASLTLWRAEPPRESIPGIILAAASLLISPFSWGSGPTRWPHGGGRTPWRPCSWCRGSCARASRGSVARRARASVLDLEGSGAVPLKHP